MAKKRYPPVAVEEARRGIYIDFEGTMKDPASFLGVLVVNDSGATEFDQPVFEENLWPVVRGRRAAEIAQALEERLSVETSFELARPPKLGAR